MKSIKNLKLLKNILNNLSSKTVKLFKFLKESLKNNKIFSLLTKCFNFILMKLAQKLTLKWRVMNFLLEGIIL